jgi:hypothetical protein
MEKLCLKASLGRPHPTVGYPFSTPASNISIYYEMLPVLTGVAAVSAFQSLVLYSFVCVVVLAIVIGTARVIKQNIAVRH